MQSKTTPLYCVCSKGHLQIVQYSIEKGSDIEAKAQQTTLHIVSYHSTIDVVKYLVSKGANKNAKNKDGKTPYESVCESSLSDKSQIIFWSHMVHF